MVAVHVSSSRSSSAGTLPRLWWAAVMAIGMGWARPVPAVAQPLQACTPEQQATWQEAWKVLGVGVDDTARGLGSRSAERYFGRGNWFPLDGEKAVVCGVAQGWSLYPGLLPDSEMDAHLHVVPGGPFSHLISDLPATARDAIDRCGEHPCLWSETTARDSFTRWLFNVPSLQALPLLKSCDCTTTPSCCTGPSAGEQRYSGDVACMYGPFVGEAAHGWRPEIHPAERLWAATTRNGRPVLDVFVLQDSSKRFDSRSHFDSGVQPPGWDVWAPSPLVARVGLAFNVARGGSISYALTSQFAEGTPGPFTPTPQPPFVRDGTTVSVSAPDWMKPSYEACSEGERVKGFVWLNVALTRRPGKSSRADGGALVFEVQRTGGSEPPAIELRTPARLAPIGEPTQDGRTVTSATATEAATPAPDEPALTVRFLKFNAGRRGASTAKLPRTRERWGISADGPVQTWDVSVSSEFWAEVRYVGTTPAAEAKAEALNERLERGEGSPVVVRWSFDARSLDNGGVALTVGRSRAPLRYLAEVFGGKAIRSHTPDSLDKARDVKGLLSAPSGPKSALIRLYTEAPILVEPEQLPLAAELEVRLELEHEGRRGSAGRVLLTHSPRVAGAGLDEHTLSDDLVRTMARWIRLQRQLTEPVPQIIRTMVNDWTLITSPRPGAPALERRASRIARLHGLASVRDGDLSPDEFTELLRLADVYASRRWPTSVVGAAAPVLPQSTRR